MRSGMSALVSASARRGSAAYWYSVVNGRNCRPLRRYNSSNGTVAWTASTPRAVRASR